MLGILVVIYVTYLHQSSGVQSELVIWNFLVDLGKKLKPPKNNSFYVKLDI